MKIETPTFEIETLREQTIRNIGKEEGQFLGLYLIGSIQTLTPSGKIYAPWTTNQTQSDIDNDAEFWEKLDESLPSGYFIHFFEDSVFIAREIDIDTPDLYAAQFISDSDENDFIDEFGLIKVIKGDLEDRLDSMLDDIYPPYKIGNLTFEASTVLKSDKPAYSEALSEFIDNELSEGDLVDIGGTYYYKKQN